MIEGFRPGVAARLGVDDDAVRAVNPSVVYCSLSGLGQGGPLALAPGHDVDYMAWAGALAPHGGTSGRARDTRGRPRRRDGRRHGYLRGGGPAAPHRRGGAHRRGHDRRARHVDRCGARPGHARRGGRPGPDGRARVRDVRDGRRSLPRPRCVERGPLLAVPCAACSGSTTSGSRLLHTTRPDRRAAGAGGRRDRGLDQRDELVAELLGADVPAAPVADREGMLANPHFAERGVVTSDPWAPVATGHPVVYRHHPAARSSPPPELDEHRGADVCPALNGRGAPARPLRTSTPSGRSASRPGSGSARRRSAASPTAPTTRRSTSDELSGLLEGGAVWVAEVGGAVAGLPGGGGARRVRRTSRRSRCGPRPRDEVWAARCSRRPPTGGPDRRSGRRHAHDLPGRALERAVLRAAGVPGPGRGRAHRRARGPAAPRRPSRPRPRPPRRDATRHLTDRPGAWRQAGPPERFAEGRPVVRHAVGACNPGRHVRSHGTHPTLIPQDRRRGGPRPGRSQGRSPTCSAIRPAR